MKTPPAHTVAKYSQGPSRVQMHPFSLLLSLALCYTNLPALPLAPSKSSKCHPEILQTPSPPNRRHSMCSGRLRTRLERVQTPKNGDRHEDQTVPASKKAPCTARCVSPSGSWPQLTIRVLSHARPPWFWLLVHCFHYNRKRMLGIISYYCDGQPLRTSCFHKKRMDSHRTCRGPHT